MKFGKHPILMQRWDGGLRILYPNGTVEWAPFSDPVRSDFDEAIGCTSRNTQEAAYNACVLYDRCESAYNRKFESGGKSLSAVLGYL